MMQDRDPPRKAVVLVVGAIGTGKSTFIKLLTNDNSVQIGDVPDSETVDIQESIYKDKNTGVLVTLVEIPGFGDSRHGITSTDVLQKIVQFLEHDGEKRLNGIIYMHRIGDLRVGGTSRKNLDMFRQLCGDNKLSNVRIVTTNWNRVDEEEGNTCEAALRAGPFKTLVDGGAHLVRQDQGITSAQSITSDLIYEEPLIMQIQEELRDGRTLGATSAGAILNQEVTEFFEKDFVELEELAKLKKELEELEKLKERSGRQGEGLEKQKETWRRQKEAFERGKEETKKQKEMLEKRREMLEELKRRKEELGGQKEKSETQKERLEEVDEVMEELEKEFDKQEMEFEEQDKTLEHWNKEFEQRNEELEQMNEKIKKQIEEAVRIKDDAIRRLEAEKRLVLQEILRMKRDQDKLNSVTLALLGATMSLEQV